MYDDSEVGESPRSVRMCLILSITGCFWAVFAMAEVVSLVSVAKVSFTILILPCLANSCSICKMKRLGSPPEADAKLL